MTDELNFIAVLRSIIFADLQSCDRWIVGILMYVVPTLLLFCGTLHGYKNSFKTGGLVLNEWQN